MTLFLRRKSITISESERSLLIAFMKAFLKDDLINLCLGRKGVVVSDAGCIYKLINQLRII